MAKRILNRKDLRADFEAAEARRKEEEGDEEEDEEEDEDDEEAESGEEREDGAEEAEAGDEDDEVEAKPKKKKKPVKEPKPKKPRAAKVVRQKVVWGVFNNSNQQVAAFDYPKRQEADDHAAKLKSESKTNQTYFVQPVRVPIE
jgi:hypothetical protein